MYVSETTGAHALQVSLAVQITAIEAYCFMKWVHVWKTQVMLTFVP